MESKRNRLIVHKSEEEVRKKILDYWNNLEPFNSHLDVPNIPRIDEKDYKKFIIPKLIECGAIPKKDLIRGQYYYGDYRNTTIAYWLGHKFIYRRYKFGSIFNEECNHFEDDDGYAVFVPLRLATEKEKEKHLIVTEVYPHADNVLKG